ncbi:MAG: hypothetical protein KAI33_08765, partial [Elusimicrobiales bacterium]|nr:hypothetical protein [Elusimicrobiales bacterium]
GYAGEPFCDRLSWHFESLDFNFEFARFGNGIRLYKNNKAIGKLGNKAIRDIKARKGKIIRIEI